MDAEVYPDPKIAGLVSDQFLSVRQHVRTHPEAMERFGVQWTPTILVLDPNGKERHRVEGFLEADALLAQLRLGLAQVAFANQQWDEAERLFEEVVEAGDTDTAPEAAYWAGVTRYKRTGDASALGATSQRLNEKFGGTAWAKKASIWGGGP
ncbi:MAG TPA: thioredoxin family protein [Thermoanaerobaculia bacterium]